MWNYEKRLEYPVNIKNPDAKLAMAIISQYGGPDGEMGASMRYLSQRYTMPNRVCMGTLTDIGREAPEMFRLFSLRTISHRFFNKSRAAMTASAFSSTSS